MESRYKEFLKLKPGSVFKTLLYEAVTILNANSLFWLKLKVFGKFPGHIFSKAITWTKSFQKKYPHVTKRPRIIKKIFRAGPEMGWGWVPRGGGCGDVLIPENKPRIGRSGQAGHLQIDTVHNLKEKFGHEQLESFLREFNIAGRTEALAEKEGRFILRQVSLDSLRNRILEEARRKNIPPSTWEVQAPV